MTVMRLVRVDLFHPTYHCDWLSRPYLAGVVEPAIRTVRKASVERVDCEGDRDTNARCPRRPAGLPPDRPTCRRHQQQRPGRRRDLPAGHHLAEHIDIIVGRTDPDPRLLKPHPHLVLRALDALHGDPATSAFIGDSTSDIQSAKAAGTHSVGYANKPGKTDRLQDAGADAVVTSMAELHTALLAHRLSS